MSLLFNGTTSDYLDCASATNLDNLSKLTYAAWIYPTSLAGDEFNIMGKGDPAGGLIHLLVGDDFGKSDILLLRVSHITTSAIARSANNTVVVNKWQFVAGTWAGGSNSPKLYYGLTPATVAEVSYQTQQAPVGAQSDDSSYKFIIGARANASSVDIPFSGELEYLWVFNQDLTLGQLQILAAGPDSLNGIDNDLSGTLDLIGSYRLFAPTTNQNDYSTKANHGTLHGTTRGNDSPPLALYKSCTFTMSMAEKVRVF